MAYFYDSVPQLLQPTMDKTALAFPLHSYRTSYLLLTESCLPWWLSLPLELWAASHILSLTACNTVLSI